MRYLVVLEATPPATPPPAELMDGIMRLGAEATRSGALLDTAGLAPSAAGARVTVVGTDLTVTDGPFAESKEMISYAIYDVRAKADAVEWASRFLQLHRDLWAGWEGEARVLQVFDPAGAPPA
ncbi:MAG TPA: hypothetical protein VEZ42_14880 [Pseudonocardia sp.]|jgi:hypothetical protein|nr:hypothetical protein [Pseudonocardia sp.]